MNDFISKVTTHSVSARGQTGSCSWLCGFRVTETATRDHVGVSVNNIR